MEQRGWDASAGKSTADGTVGGGEHDAGTGGTEITVRRRELPGRFGKGNSRTMRDFPAGVGIAGSTGCRGIGRHGDCRSIGRRCRRTWRQREARPRCQREQDGEQQPAAHDDIVDASGRQGQTRGITPPAATSADPREGKAELAGRPPAGVRWSEMTYCRPSPAYLAGSVS